MRLLVFHYHLRPGGIRRIIELALPHLLHHAPRAVTTVVLATGEAADAEWARLISELSAPVPVQFRIEPGFGYVSELKGAPAALRLRIAHTLRELLQNGDATNCLVWAHNLGIGRNLRLGRELTRACAERDIPMIAHHHDWWFDNRWRRWSEMRHSGFRTLRAVAETIFSPSTQIRHAAISHTDARFLRRHLDGRVSWLPNLTEPAPQPEAKRLREVRSWLTHQLATKAAPVWILPCRLLRRKNVAEALLLTRWLRPEAWLVTTGGVSSSEERLYASGLAAAAREHGWPLRLGVLAGDEPGKPSVSELLAASEAVLLTSVQEGFGLPYLEASAAGRPLVARLLPNIAPDLKRFGFHFPQSYSDLLIHPSLFDWSAEVTRQRQLSASWRNQIPRVYRSEIAEPDLLAKAHQPRPLPFSRLTLTAQLEVLCKPLHDSWTLCAPLNPFLPRWRELAKAGCLQTTVWPARARAWLSGPSYAMRFWRLARTELKVAARDAALATQDIFIREKLKAENLFPLLWSTRT